MPGSASTLIDGATRSRAPSGMQSPRPDTPSVLVAGQRYWPLQELLVAIERAWGMTPFRISNVRTMPARKLTPAPVAPPLGPRPSPSRLAQVPQLVVHCVALTRLACQKSHDFRATRSTMIMAPSLPLFGRALDGMRIFAASRSHGPQFILQSTLARGELEFAVKIGAPNS